MENESSDHQKANDRGTEPDFTSVLPSMHPAPRSDNATTSGGSDRQQPAAVSGTSALNVKRLNGASMERMPSRTSMNDDASADRIHQPAPAHNDSASPTGSILAAGQVKRPSGDLFPPPGKRGIASVSPDTTDRGPNAVQASVSGGGGTTNQQSPEYERPFSGYTTAVKSPVTPLPSFSQRRHYLMLAGTPIVVGEWLLLACCLVQVVVVLSQPSPSRCQASPHIHVARRRLSRTLVCCSVVASAFAVGALSLLVIRHGTMRAPPSLCETEDCVRHAQSILATMNESADPCTDFHAYVCGGRDGDWDAESTIGTLERAYRRDVMETLGNVTAFLTAREIPTAAIKAFTAVADCLSRRDEATTDNFTEFMRARGVPWPHPPNASVIESGALGVLGVLLDLAINWGVGLWFEVTLSQEISPYSVPLVIIRESGQLPLQRMEQLAGLDEVAYENLIQNLSLQLSEREVTLHDAAVAELRADENSFKRILSDSKAKDAGERFDTMMRVGDLATVFGGAISPLELTALLVKHFSGTVANFSADTRVLVLNRKQFGLIGSLVGSLPPRRLLNVIGWTFAYTYAWIANVDDVLSAPPHDDLYIYVRCFVAVQESFGIVQAAPIFQTALNAQERQRVVEILECTSTALASIIKKSPRPAESTKKEAMAKVGSLSSRWLWPPVRYLHGPSLDLLYSSFPDGGNTFFETWMLSKVALRAAFNSSYYGSIMTSRYRWRSGGVLYLYTLNELCLSLSAVFPPSYLQGGSIAMSYAGLGFQLARQIVRSVDLRGRALDRTGHSKCWWKLSKRGERPCRLDRAKSAKERRLVADLFALDVALEAMQASLLQDPTEPPLRLKSLERLTDVQTFYVSYCSHFCREPRGLVMCNLARNGSKFGSAFGCQPRPQMRPTCLFV